MPILQADPESLSEIKKKIEHNPKWVGAVDAKSINFNVNNGKIVADDGLGRGPMIVHGVIHAWSAVTDTGNHKTPGTRYTKQQLDTICKYYNPSLTAASYHVDVRLGLEDAQAEALLKINDELQSYIVNNPDKVRGMNSSYDELVEEGATAEERRDFLDNMKYAGPPVKKTGRDGDEYGLKLSTKLCIRQSDNKGPTKDFPTMLKAHLSRMEEDELCYRALSITDQYGEQIPDSTRMKLQNSYTSLTGYVTFDIQRAISFTKTEPPRFRFYLKGVVICNSMEQITEQADGNSGGAGTIGPLLKRPVNPSISESDALPPLLCSKRAKHDTGGDDVVLPASGASFGDLTGTLQSFHK